MRFAPAFVVAVVSDVASVFTEFVPPVQWAIDVGTAFVLYLLLGRNWLLLPGLIAEAIPGVAMFPSWVLVVAVIGAGGGLRLPQTQPRP
jgi:hypothetical protein